MTRTNLHTPSHATPQNRATGAHSSPFMNNTFNYARHILSLLLIALFITSTASKVAAASGDPDPDFGANGQATLDVFGFGDSATAAVLQPDGKIVVAGYANHASDAQPEPTQTPGASTVPHAIQNMSAAAAGEANADFVVARFNADGSPDSTFNVTGRVTTDFEGLNDFGNDVALQPDGRIVVVGTATKLTDFGGFSVPTAHIGVARYNTDGTLDETFGTKGKLVVEGSGTGQAIKVVPNSKILVAGALLNAEQFDSEFALIRLNANGSFDSEFSGDGIALTDFDGEEDSDSLDVPFDLIYQANTNKIIVVGTSGLVESQLQNDFAVARYNATGTLDNSFGAGGTVRTDISGGFDGATGVAIQTDGKIVLVGTDGLAESEDTPDFAVVRYNTNGSLDETFDTDGKLITDFSGGDDGASSVVIQADGKIVVAGGAQITRRLTTRETPQGGSSDDADMAIARYTTTGALDETFGDLGKLTIDFFGYGDGASDMVRLSNGNLLLVGEAGKQSSYRGNGDRTLDHDDIALAQIINDDAGGGTGGEQGTTLISIADAFVRGATPNVNYGNAPEMQVKRTLNPGNGKGRQAYIRFDTSGVTGEITNATLRIYGRLNAVTNQNVNLPVAAFPLSDATWTETGLTWANKPAPNVPKELTRVQLTNYRTIKNDDGAVGEDVTVPDASARWYEFDITTYIQQERAAGRAVTGIILRNMTSGGIGDFYTVFNSREAAENKPELVINRQVNQ